MQQHARKSSEIRHGVTLRQAPERLAICLLPPCHRHRKYGADLTPGFAGAAPGFDDASSLLPFHCHSGSLCFRSLVRAREALSIAGPRGRKGGTGGRMLSQHRKAFPPPWPGCARPRFSLDRRFCKLPRGPRCELHGEASLLYDQLSKPTMPSEPEACPLKESRSSLGCRGLK